MTVLLYTITRKRIFQKLPKWSQFLFFGSNFFRDENRENFLLSTDRNMVFPQILIYIPLLYDQWLHKICELPPASSFAITFRGAAGWKMGATLQN